MALTQAIWTTEELGKRNDAVILNVALHSSRRYAVGEMPTEISAREQGGDGPGGATRMATKMERSSNLCGLRPQPGEHQDEH